MGRSSPVKSRCSLTNQPVELVLPVLVQRAHPPVPDPLTSHRCLQTLIHVGLRSRAFPGEHQEVQVLVPGWAVGHSDGL